MARDFSPSCKKARRFKKDLSLKSRAKDIEHKCKFAAMPGQHGAKKKRSTDYGVQHLAKQMLRAIYGVLEKQFRLYYAKASRMKGATGELLLQLLETRLDNVVYRMGFGSTRAESRQLVKHKAIVVNGASVNIPSYRVKAGDVIEVREKSKVQARIQESMRMAENAGFDEWIEVDPKALKGTFKRVPDRSELPADLNEKLVVELYSK